MNLVTVHTAVSLGQAEVVRSRLETAGFHPTVQNELSALPSMIEGGVRVQVPEEEAKDAQALLAAEGPPAE
jgi:hypothetical protein